MKVTHILDDHSYEPKPKTIKRIQKRILAYAVKKISGTANPNAINEMIAMMVVAKIKNMDAKTAEEIISRINLVRYGWKKSLLNNLSLCCAGSDIVDELLLDGEMSYNEANVRGASGPAKEKVLEKTINADKTNFKTIIAICDDMGRQLTPGEIYKLREKIEKSKNN